MTVITVRCTSQSLRSEIKNVIPTLGIGIAGFYGWTISLPTGDFFRMSISNGIHYETFKMRWGNCTPTQQLQYLKDTYLPRVVSPSVDVAMAVPELTNNGNIHLHLLCYNTQLKNEYDMATIRKDVLQNPLSVRFHKMRKNAITALNYIHFIEDIEDWICYMSKDLDKHEYPCLIVK